MPITNKSRLTTVINIVWMLAWLYMAISNVTVVKEGSSYRFHLEAYFELSLSFLLLPLLIKWGMTRFRSIVEKGRQQQ